MAATHRVPHPFPYQGSKRKLAHGILRCIPAGTRRLVEPFAGSAAITIAVAHHRRSDRFLLNDLHRPLIDLWSAIIRSPQALSDSYETLWKQQSGREREFYDHARDRFNATHEPHLFLYLLARCVKAAVRYNGKGEFNNSPDNRRLGMHPDTMRYNITQTSALLAGRVRVTCRDYREVLSEAVDEDVVYMDPPYQGVSDTRDHRYCGGVRFDEFVEALDNLNRRRIPFIVSYDGRTGDKVHGQPLPRSLKLVHREQRVGRSTQATLLGRNHETVESLYLSPALVKLLDTVPRNLDRQESPTLFASMIETP